MLCRQCLSIPQEKSFLRHCAEAPVRNAIRSAIRIAFVPKRGRDGFNPKPMPVFSAGTKVWAPFTGALQLEI